MSFPGGDHLEKKSTAWEESGEAKIQKKKDFPPKTPETHESGT